MLLQNLLEIHGKSNLKKNLNENMRLGFGIYLELLKDWLGFGRQTQWSPLGP